MDRAEQFLASVLPSVGPYIIAFKHKSRQGMGHRVCQTIAEMVTESKPYVDRNCDVYLCVSSILDPQFRNEKGVVSPRNQRNCKSTRSLILDIDVGDTQDKYGSKEEALEGLTKFQQEMELPIPAIVDSGYGYHVYWPMAEDVSSVDWNLLSVKFKTSLKEIEPKLIADGSRVSDCASLLRLPYTYNHKREPREVTVISRAEDAKLFAFYRERIGGFIPDRPPVQRLNIPQDLMKFLPDTDELHNLRIIVNRCNWMREYSANRASASEPEWYAALGLIKHTESGGKNAEQLAIALSQGHPGFSEEATLAKLEHVKEGQSGPTLCTTFRQLKPKRCEGCIYASAVRTPLRLDKIDNCLEGPIVKEEVLQQDGTIGLTAVQLPKPPFPYQRAKDGGVFVRQLNEEGEVELEKIYDYDLFPIRRLKDEETDNEIVEISVTLPRDGERVIKVPSGLFMDYKKLGVALGDKGVFVHPKESARITAYLVEYAKLIQKEGKAQEAFARFGWRDIDGTDPRFILGDVVIDKLGNYTRSSPAHYLAPIRDTVSAMGNLDEWRKAMKIYTDVASMPFKLAILLGFATPLFALTKHFGMIYNMVGSGGEGKSTALKFISSIWGKPKCEQALVKDSAISLVNTIGYYQNLPICLDEMTTLPSDKLVDLAYTVTQGRGKNRADRTGANRVNTTMWKTIVIGTSNTSLYEKLAMHRTGNNAHAYRIFEVNTHPSLVENSPKILTAENIIEHNHGMAGRLFATYLVKNVRETLAVLINTQEEITEKHPMSSTAERYYYSMFGCAATGAHIASSKLGLIDFDINQVMDFAVRESPRIRAEVRNVEGDPISLISFFMSSQLKSTLHVENGEQKSNPNGDYINALNMRVEHEAAIMKRAYISIPALREFCEVKHIDNAWLIKKLVDTGVGFDAGNVRLGAGSKLDFGLTKCLMISLTHKLFEGENKLLLNMPLIEQLNTENRVH